VEESISSLVKDKIGAFKVVRSLGKGIMGEVFLGMTSDNVHNAIKIIDYNVVNKLADAVKVEHDIKDDAIMKISIRNDPKLQDYFVMDFLEVRPISRKIVGPYGHTRILELFCTVAAAMEKAHAADLIHGNIKSTNILVRRSPKSLLPFVNDFGLDYIWNEDYFDSDRILSCVPYMSPEKMKALIPGTLADDDVGEVSPKSDVYSLAVVICEALTGKLLFADTDEVEGIADSKRTPRFQLIAVTHPSRKIDIKTLNDLVTRGLSFAQDDRPSMKEFAEGLEACKVPKEKMFSFD
jgi:serine/threonine protein kinase